MSIRKIFSRYKTAFVAVIVAIVSVIGYSFVDDFFPVTKNLDIFASLFRDVNIYYVDSVNPDKLMKKGIDEMLNSLDPYTDFIPESGLDDYHFMTTGQYGGIGAVIRVSGDYTVISDPYDGFPAQKSGLIAGDMIMKIDGVSAKGKKTDDVSHLLKGTPGTDVKLTIKREGIDGTIEKVVTRAEIKVKSVPYYGIVRDGIGYIKLNNFTEGASREITDALKEMKASGNLKGVVFDIRGNPGGLLNEAVNITNIFVDKGQDIVSTKGKIKENYRVYKAINETVDRDIPLAVLVNSSSASASEIVSGSLQDLDRAVIVGQRTFGKGLVQTTRNLPYNTQLKITTSKYYIPSGRCIQALDYAHRNEDGSVGKIPDSLLSAFKTHSGRTVYDGGGILPDKVTEPEKLSNISISLLSKNIIFDYATRYYLKHPSTASTKIQLTDSDFSDFQQFISTKDYDYSTKSERSLEELRKNAEDENYLSELKGSLDSLKAKMDHNKQEDVVRNKKEIVSLIEEEVASRYFYQAGRVRQALNNDSEFDIAVEILKDPARYSGILSGTIKADVGNDDGKKR